LTNLAETSKESTVAIKELEKFLSAGSATFTNADAKIEKFVNSTVNASEELAETLKQLRLILIKVNKGEGTAGRIINDGRLYENLLENTQQLELLLEELQTLTTKWRDKGVGVKLK